MKKFVVLMLISSCIFASEIVIKSLHVYPNKEYTNPPIILMNTSDRITISFEIESEHEPDFNIKFKFCNSDWEPYDNLLLETIGGNTLHNVRVERLPSTTQGAQYYVRESFPKENIKFPTSGKWMFFIVDPFDEDIVYEFGKFYVVENIINLSTNIQNWRREGKISDNNANDRVLNFKTQFTISDSLDPFRIDHIEIIKNQLFNYPVILKKDSFAKNRDYYWDGAHNFEFTIRDLEPGNEYRQANLKDQNKYPYPLTRANFEGIDYSRFYQLGHADFNGGFKLMSSKNEYSDYLITTFEFKPPNPESNDIFIVGSFTNWEVLPWFKLENKNEVYTINLELKRGEYDYQYVTGEINNEEVENINWFIFEGNFWETKNVYSVFLYYKSPENGEYDKIIGYKQIVR